MKIEGQEKAAQWIAENISCLPQNVGELTAILTEYAQSKLPSEEEIKKAWAKHSRGGWIDYMSYSDFKDAVSTLLKDK